MNDQIREITVHSKPNSNGKLSSIRIEDITYIESDRPTKSVVVHTISGETYYTMGSVKGWAKSLIEAGHGFVCGDNGVFINVTHINGIDNVLFKVYFENDTKGCFVSLKGMRIILKKVGNRVSVVDKTTNRIVMY